MPRSYDAMRQVYDRLDELVALVEAARAVPLSASCMVPREQVLDLLDEVRAGLPGAVDDARKVVAAREELLGQARDRRDRALARAQDEAASLVAAAREEAEQLRAAARAEYDRLVSSAVVELAAQANARGVLEQAEQAARQLRADADDYVERQLAGLAEALQATLRTVHRGRQLLAARVAGEPAARDTPGALPVERGRPGADGGEQPESTQRYSLR